MIKNQKQAAIVKKEITDLVNLLSGMDELLSEKELDIKQQLQYNVLKSRVDDLKAEISEYENLISGDLQELKIESDDLQKAIISFRIASGLTQKDLAEKLEIQEQQIQRYEQQDYLTASFERIIQILQTLGVEVILRKEFLKSTKAVDFSKFLIPEDYKSKLESNIKKVTGRKQLLVG